MSSAGSANGSVAGSATGSEDSEGSRHIQFGKSPGSSSSSSTTQSESASPSIASDEFDNVNERLRHHVPTKEFHATPSKRFDEIAALVYMAVMKACLHEITILREVNKMSAYDVALQYVPLTDKYTNAEHEIDVIIASNEDFLTYKKFRKDISWLERVLRATVVDLERTFYYEDLINILHDEELNRQEEKTLLGSKEFNRREVQKLRTYIDQEKEELTKAIQEVTEAIGRAKDQLNDNIAESLVKIKYIKQWQRSRMEQNELVLDQKEETLKNTIIITKVDIEKENRIHDELFAFLNISLEDYSFEIERWMDKYDTDIEEKERQVQELKFMLETKKDTHNLLKIEFAERQSRMEAYKAHKIEKQKEAEELERRTYAATIIQSWWRGVMLRRGLGPYKKRKGKGKGKKSGKNKNSAMRKKKK